MSGDLIYFIQRGDNGPIKIGRSKELKSRLSAIQTHCPETVVLLLALSGDARKESSIQRQFAHLHKNGEWFDPGEDLLKFISETSDGKKMEIGAPLQKGIFFSISDELNAKFHVEIEKRLGRKIKRGDLTAIGNEMIENWIGA